MCVSGYMPQKIRVGRSENLFFFFFYFFFTNSLIDVMIIMHHHIIMDQGIMVLLLINEVVDSFFGLELKLLGIR